MMKLTQIDAIAFIGSTIATPAIAQDGPGHSTGMGSGGNKGMSVMGNRDPVPIDITYSY